MLTCTPFTVVLIDDEGPWLIACLETLGHTGDRVGLAFGWTVLVVKCDVYFATFVVQGLPSIQNLSR